MSFVLARCLTHGPIQVACWIMDMPILDQHVYRNSNFGPADDSLLWRYMDFPKYCSLLLNKELFFCRLGKLIDPYEGAITKADYQVLEKYHSHPKVEDIEPDKFRQWMRHVKDEYLVNCWHLNEQESAAMWSLYGRQNQAIAVTTRFASMLRELPQFVCAGAVDYIDPETQRYYFLERGAVRGEHAPVLWKRMSFQHEREVRFFFSGLTVMMFAPGAPLPPELRGAGADAFGSYVSVNLERIVEAVYVDPTAPSWFYDLVAKISERNGLGDVVRRSRLLMGPDYL